MQKLVLSALGAVILAWVVLAAAPANFSGTWSLDKTKSQGLSAQMAGADITWTIVQDDKTLKKEVTGGRFPQNESYQLDGKETTADVMNGAGKATRTATVMGEGNMIELKSVTKGERDGTAFTFTTVQHLELADAGKTLKVHQISERQNGKNESTLVFSKK